MRLLLEIVEGAGAGKQVPLEGPLEVGREAGVSLLLEDEEVSRHHARIEPTGDGAMVYDLGSTNGTYINDQPLGAAQRLSPGDRLRLGLTVLELRTREQVAQQPSAIGPIPQITQLGRDVLQPVPTDELAPVSESSPNVPGFMVEESEPAFVPRAVVENQAGGSQGAESAAGGADELARLIDTRVKRQTTVAAFAVLALAGMALLIFFGAR